MRTKGCDQSIYFCTCSTIEPPTLTQVKNKILISEMWRKRLTLLAMSGVMTLNRFALVSVNL